VHNATDERYNNNWRIYGRTARPPILTKTTTAVGRVSRNSYFTFTSWSRTLDSLPVIGVGTAIVNLWAAAYKMVICFVFGCNHSSQKNCCSFYRSQPGQDAKGRPNINGSAGFGAVGNHSRIAWDSRNLERITTYSMRCNNSAMSECIYKRNARCTNTVVTSH